MKEQPKGEVVVTWDEQRARILAVTRQDKEGRILSVIAEAPAKQQEPVAKLHDDGYWTPMKTEAGRALNDRLMRAGSPSIDVYAVPVAQQPQARPDFTDEWTGYLKDGETPFERFLRERKDLGALTKLYQRALEENERLKAQQPQAENISAFLRSEREDWEEREPKAQAEAVQQKPKLIGWRTSDYLMETSDKDKADNWAVHNEILPIFEGDPYTKLVAAPQQAEVAPTDADLDSIIEKHLHSYWQYGALEQDRLRALARTLIATKAAPQQAEAVPVVDRVYEAAKRLVDHADFQLGGVLSAKSKARDIPSNAASKVKARHLASLRDALAKAPQQAEAVPPDVVRDAERYRWLRNESWAGYNTGKGAPSVYTVDGAGNRRMMLAEGAMDDAIDAAIAQQKGGV